MRNKLANKLGISVFLVFLMLSVFSSQAFSKTLFKDIESNHWAFMDIAKLNARGVVSGYNDSSFKPVNPVTQLEAVLMAVHNMGADLSAVNVDQPLPVSVPAWAEKGNKRELIFALEKGLIVPSENKFNANSSASRAWVAQLMVRMINKNLEANQLAGEPVSAQDAGDIPDWARGYVAAAYKYQLLSGYPDGTFRPNQSVTRAEIVSLLSRSEQYLNLSESLFVAKVTGISGDSVSLLVNNSAKVVTISPKAWVFSGQNLVSAVGNLKKDDAVKLALNGSTVKYVEILPSNVVVNKVSGTVMQVLVREKVVVIKDDQQRIVTGSLTASATVSSQSGKISGLNTIASGSKVELSFNTSDSVVSVLVLDQAASQSSAAILYNIDQTQKLIMVKNSAGRFDTYQYSDSLQIKIQGKNSPVIGDLQVGDEVTLSVASGKVTVIELIHAQKQLTVTGKIMVVSQDQNFLTIQRDDSSFAAYPISPNVVISISGVTTPLLSSVLVNDRADLLVEAGRVTAIAVQNRTTEEIIKGTVVAVDTSNRILTFKTDDGTLKVFEVSNGAQFTVNDNTTTSMSNVKKDMKAELRLLNNKVIYLKNDNTVKGTLTTLDAGRRIITIVSDDLGSRSYMISSDVSVGLEGYSRPALSDVKINDFVELRVEDNSVTKINVQKTYTYEITQLSSSSRQITARSDNGSTHYLTLDNAVILIVPGIAYPALNDVKVGDVIKATFLGTKLSSVEVIPVNRGQVTDINIYLNKITVQSFAGVSTAYDFGTNSKIVKSGQDYKDLAKLAVGDRVAVKAMTNGGLSFEVLTKVTGKLASYTTDGSKISVAKDPITWNSYSVSPVAYLHSGSKTLTLNDIGKDANVDIYLLQETVYEVEKK